jgi:beta-glucosidase
VLPLDVDIGSIALIGPNADNPKAMYYPHYYPNPPKIVTLLQGIQKKVPSQIEIKYAKGCELEVPSEDKERAIQIAQESDIIIGVFGLTGEIEGEEGYVLGPLCGDRENLKLPEVQEELIKELNELGKPLILILTSGSALDLGYAKEKVPAIIQAWYAGCEGGNAIADILFGDNNPAGRLPITFYKSVDQLPDYEDYNMEGRTYRYFEGEVIYPFGYGLSYSRFEYKNLQISPQQITEDDNIVITVDIENLGPYSGEEVAQVYIGRNDLEYRVPKHELKAFKRVLIKKEQIKTVNFTLSASELKSINMDGKSIFEPGKITCYVGGCQPGFGYGAVVSKKLTLEK